MIRHPTEVRVSRTTTPDTVCASQSSRDHASDSHHRPEARQGPVVIRIRPFTPVLETESGAPFAVDACTVASVSGRKQRQGIGRINSGRLPLLGAAVSKSGGTKRNESR